MERFLMIYVEGGNTPTQKYDLSKPHEIDMCKAEARRLAKFTGRKAYILNTVRSVEVNEFKEIDLATTDDLPF